MNIGFIGLGVMGMPMAANVIRHSGHAVWGFDTVSQKKQTFTDLGGIWTDDPGAIYQNCQIILQMLPTHQTIIDSVTQAIALSPAGTIVVDMSSAAPDIIIDLHSKAERAGIGLVDAPVSGGNPMAIAGTLAIMAGGREKDVQAVLPVLQCMGHPVYTGGPGSGDMTKLVNNSIGGAMLAALAEGYAFAEKAGIDLQTTFEATRTGFVGGPLYENKVPKIIAHDYEPGARIAVHRKDLLNAKQYSHALGIDLPMTDVALLIMDWMKDNGLIDADQSAMIEYFKEKMHLPRT